jgi:hypothetical protein
MSDISPLAINKLPISSHCLAQGKGRGLRSLPLGKTRGSQSDVVHLVLPIAPSNTVFMSPNAGVEDGGRGGCGSQLMSNAVHMEPK